MSQGPDGTNGFAVGWTTRVSPYAPPPQEDSGETIEGTPQVEDAASPLKDKEDISNEKEDEEVPLSKQ